MMHLLINLPQISILRSLQCHSVNTSAIIHKQIYTEVIRAAAERASFGRGETRRQFAPPRRIDDEPGWQAL